MSTEDKAIGSQGEIVADTSPRWAVNIIHTCMGVQPGERVLLIVDEPLGYMRDALLVEAPKAKPAELWSYTFPDAVRPIAELPPRVLAVAKEMDGVLLFLAFLDPVQEIPALVGLGKHLMDAGVRYSSGAYIDRGILEHELSADYQQIAAFTHSLADRLRGRSSVHITTPLGTDLWLSVAGCEWRTDSGIFHHRGASGNLPAGEVYVAPVEDSAEGVLVIDKSLPGLVLPQPVRLVFEKGRVTHIEGEPRAAYLHQAIAHAEGQPNGEWSRVIGELGIGTNPRARLQGNLMTDEKVAGTIHIAIGRNDHLGGKSPASIHIDGVVSQPTVRVDGDLLIDRGQHRLNN